VSALATKARTSPRSGFGEIGGALSRRPLSIGYFGASVTAQKEGYRPRLHRRLCERFKQDHQSLFAGVGGIDIVSAAFLADELIGNRRPDLCLVEFTTASLIWGSTLDEAEAAMNGVLAKLGRAGTRPCLLHLARGDWNDDHAAILAAFERVTDRRRVPSIDLTGAFLERMRRHDEAERLYRDEVHLTPTGGELAAELIDTAIASIAGRPVEAGEPPSELTCSHGDARFIPVSPEDAQGPAEMRQFRLQRPYLELPAADRIRRRFDDRLAGLVLVVGPDAGELEITDEGGTQRVMTWDDWCHYERFTACLFPRPTRPGSDVSIAVTDTVPDYDTCRIPMQPPACRTAKVIGYMTLLA
jgi:hypothetical protein